MEIYRGQVVAVLSRYPHWYSGELFEEELKNAWVQDIKNGYCDRLSDINQITISFPEKADVSNCLKTRDYSTCELRVIVDVYEMFSGKNENIFKIKSKLTRGVVVFLYELAKKNQNQLQKDENGRSHYSDTYVIQHDKCEMHTKGENTISQHQETSVNDCNDQIKCSQESETTPQVVFAQTEQEDTAVGQKNACYEQQEHAYLDQHLIVSLDKTIEQQDQQTEQLEQKMKKFEDEYNQRKQELETYIANSRAQLEQEKKAMLEETINQCEILRSERQKEIDDYVSQKKAKADSDAQIWFEESLKDKVNSYLKEKEESWKSGHQEFDDIRREITRCVGTSKLECCNEASRIQREFVEQMNAAMAQFGANMDKWRDSMYSAQFNEFADWASSFYGFVDRFDKRISDNVDNEEISPDIMKHGKTLITLRNQLDRAMLGMGLRCFYPKNGEKVDPVYHEVDTENDVGIDAEIHECKKPGIAMGLADTSSVRILSKAKVLIKE